MEARRGSSMACVETLKDDEIYLIHFVPEITNCVRFQTCFISCSRSIFFSAWKVVIFRILAFTSTYSFDGLSCFDITVTLFHALQSRTTISAFQLLLPCAVSSENGSLFDKQISVSLGSQHSLLLFA